MNATKGFVIAAALIFSPGALADFFVHVGQSEYFLPDNGIYYQDGHRSDQQMKASYLRLGLEKEFDDIAVRVSAFSTGSWTLEAEATPADDQYTMHTPNRCVGPCPPLVRWVTHGSLAGLSLSALTKWGPLSIEIGGTYYQTKLSIHVFNPNGSDLAGYQVDNLRENGFGYMLGIEYKPTKQLRFGATFFAFDANYVDVRLAEANMPAGVTMVYALYAGVVI